VEAVILELQAGSASDIRAHDAQARAPSQERAPCDTTDMMRRPSECLVARPLLGPGMLGEKPTFWRLRRGRSGRGRVFCARHGGYRGRSAQRASPNLPTAKKKFLFFFSWCGAVVKETPVSSKRNRFWEIKREQAGEARTKTWHSLASLLRGQVSQGVLHNGMLILETPGFPVSTYTMHCSPVCCSLCPPALLKTQIYTSTINHESYPMKRKPPSPFRPLQPGFPCPQTYYHVHKEWTSQGAYWRQKKHRRPHNIAKHVFK
jgi:hypothetical protein